MPTPPATDGTGQTSNQGAPSQVNTHTGTQVPNEATPPAAKPDEASAKFAALARKEKAIRAREAASKAAEAEQGKQLEAKLNSMRTEIEQSYRSKLLNDPWAFFSENGLTPEQVTQMMLHQPQPHELQIKSLEKKLADLEAQNAKATENQAKAAKDEYEQARQITTNRVKLLVDGNEKFETIATMGEHGAVVDLMQAYLDEDNIEKTVEEAAQEVEDYLVEELLKFTKTKKLQSRLAPPPAEAQQQGQPTKPQAQTLSRNLSNQTAPKRLTEQERIQRAILAAQGKLQS